MFNPRLRTFTRGKVIIAFMTISQPTFKEKKQNKDITTILQRLTSTYKEGKEYKDFMTIVPRTTAIYKERNRNKDLMIVPRDKRQKRKEMLLMDFMISLLLRDKMKKV